MYIYANPNPVAGNRTGDCVVRAIALALDMSWDDVYDDLCLIGKEMGDWGNKNEVWGAYLKQHGFRRYAIPNTCPDCYTVKDFCLDHPRGTYILGTGTHVVCTKDGNHLDAWNSSDECPVFYWEKGRDDR